MPARLRKARKTASLTRTALALKVGGDQTTALDIETEQRLPTVRTIARLASALGITAGWLAYGLGDMMVDGPAATTDGMAERLQAVRVERELTKAALARLVNLTPSTVGDIEKGAQSGVEVIEALAKALDVSPAWLAFNQGPQLLPKRRRVTKSPTPTDAE